MSIVKQIKSCLLSIIKIIYYILPNYPKFPKIYFLFEPYRKIVHKKMFAKFGQNTFLRSNVRFAGSISIGKNGIIGPNSILNASSVSIEIGDYFLAGPELIIYTAEHGIENNGIPFILQNNTHEKVHIGNNVYIGARVTILKGAKIGDNVVIGTGSIVKGVIESNSIYAGIPAKKIKDI